MKSMDGSPNGTGSVGLDYCNNCNNNNTGNNNNYYCSIHNVLLPAYCLAQLHRNRWWLLVL